MMTERISDCLLAGLIGDAWGWAYEGHKGPIDAPFPAPARISDDSALTLATCEAIVAAAGRVEPETVARAFVLWFAAGRVRGVGSFQEAALRVGTSGRASEAVPLALFIASRSLTQGIESAVLSAVACGGDTDSIGSICAQVVGARPLRSAVTLA